MVLTTYSSATKKLLDEIEEKLEVSRTIVLDGWPYPKLTNANLYDMVAVYHELNLHNLSQPSAVLRTREDITKHRWFVAGNIVARIQRDNQER